MSDNVTNSKALKSGMWYTIANFLMRSIGFLTTPIFTRILTKADFGVFNNYSSWLSIFTIIITLNLDSTFISARYDFKKSFDQYIYSVLMLSSLSSLIWTIVLNVVNCIFPLFMNLDTMYLNIMLIYILFLPAINMFQTRERYLFEYKQSVFISLLVSVGTSLVSVVLVIWLSDKLTARIIGSVIPSILIGIVLYVIIIKRGKKIDFSCWKYALPICLPYIPHLLALVLLNQMDRIMITQICGDEDNAIYSLAANCGTIIMILVTSLNTAFSPWLGKMLNEKRDEEINSFTKRYIVLFIMMSVGIMLISPEILYIMGGIPYMEAKFVMTPVALGCIFQFLYIFFVDVEQFNKKTQGMAIASVVAALTNYILNLYFIPQYGYIAAAYTTAVGYLVLLVFHMLLVKRLSLDNIYSYPYIMGVVIICSLLTIVVSILYGCDNKYRYVLLILYSLGVVLVLLKRKEEMKIIMDMVLKKKR